MKSNHFDEMLFVDKSITNKDLVRIMLLKAGVCDDSTLSSIENSDDEAIEKLWTDLFLSYEFERLLNYLRS